MSKIKHNLCLFLFFSIFVNEVLTQDVHFSQRLVNDRQVNAAFLNHFDGNLQAITAYRQQWRAVGVPFTTGNLLLTKRITTSIPVLEFFGGLAYTNDKSGDAKLTINQVNLNIGAAYRYLQHKFSFAVQNGLVAKSFNQGGLTFPSQYDRNTGGFNEQLASNEVFAGENSSYFDLSLGALWETEFTNNWELAIGLSVSHLLEPEESFFDQGNQKSRGVGVQALAEKALNERLKIHPYLTYYWARGASEMMVGSAVSFPLEGFKMVDELKPFMYLRSGVLRTTDAFVVGSRASMGMFDFGVSYDVNISDLELASNYKGGIELSLIFTARDPKLKQIRIPCERY